MSTESCLSFSLTSKAGHARVRVPAVGVERLNSLQVGVEASTVEERLLSPGQPVALARRERVAEPRRVDRLHALEIERVDENRPFFFTAGRSHEQAREDDAEDTSPHVGSLETQRVPESGQMAPRQEAPNDEDRRRCWQNRGWEERGRGEEAGGWDWFSPAPSPQPCVAIACRLTVRAARRLSRRVSSRALSYFGRSSP